MDAQVFGEIAGRSAAEEAGTLGLTPVGVDRTAQWSARLEALWDRTHGLSASQVRSRIQAILSGCASVVRTEKGLTEGLSALAALKAGGIHADAKGCAFAMETRNMYDVAEMVMRAACMRDESRGPHLYFAHPDDAHPMPRNDETWQQTIVLRKGRDGMIPEARTPVRPF